MTIDNIGMMLSRLQAKLDLMKRDNGDHMKLSVEWENGWVATITILRPRGVLFVGPSFRVGSVGKNNRPYFTRKHGDAIEVATAAVDTAMMYFDSCTQIEPYMVTVSTADTTA